jgi:hypothetical protein
MAESSSTNQQNSRAALAGLWARIELFITFGLAAMITSGFGAGNQYLEGGQRAYEQRCSIAQQVVLDDVPNEALDRIQRARLNGLALQRIEQCLGGTQ